MNQSSYTMTWLGCGDFQFEFKGIPQFTVKGDIDILKAVEILRAMDLFNQVYPEGSDTSWKTQMEETGTTIELPKTVGPIVVYEDTLQVPPEDEFPF